VGKRAFPPLPNRPQLVAVYPALFFSGVVTPTSLMTIIDQKMIELLLTN